MSSLDIIQSSHTCHSMYRCCEFVCVVPFAANALCLWPLLAQYRTARFVRGLPGWLLRPPRRHATASSMTEPVQYVHYVFVVSPITSLSSRRLLSESIVFTVLLAVCVQMQVRRRRCFHFAGCRVLDLALKGLPK